jgi:hypothetical protein
MNLAMTFSAILCGWHVAIFVGRINTSLNKKALVPMGTNALARGTTPVRQAAAVFKKKNPPIMRQVRKPASLFSSTPGSLATQRIPFTLITVATPVQTTPSMSNTFRPTTLRPIRGWRTDQALIYPGFLYRRLNAYYPSSSSFNIWFSSTIPLPPCVAMIQCANYTA